MPPGRRQDKTKFCYRDPIGQTGRPSEYVTGRLAGVANLASGRFAMIEDGLGFQLVPWQPVLEKRLDQHISGVRRDDGGIEWSFGRKRQIGIGL